MSLANVTSRAAPSVPGWAPAGDRHEHTDDQQSEPMHASHRNSLRDEPNNLWRRPLVSPQIAREATGCHSHAGFTRRVRS